MKTKQVMMTLGELHKKMDSMDQLQKDKVMVLNPHLFDNWTPGEYSDINMTLGTTPLWIQRHCYYGMANTTDSKRKQEYKELLEKSQEKYNKMRTQCKEYREFYFKHHKEPRL